MLRNPSRCIEPERKRTVRHHDLIRFAVSWTTWRRDGPEIHETLHILNPERRNIVAQVRREPAESSVFPDRPINDAKRRRSLNSYLGALKRRRSSSDYGLYE